jgi:hypothetical protein
MNTPKLPVYLPQFQLAHLPPMKSFGVKQSELFPKDHRPWG